MISLYSQQCLKTSRFPRRPPKVEASMVRRAWKAASLPLRPGALHRAWTTISTQDAPQPRTPSMNCRSCSVATASTLEDHTATPTPFRHNHAVSIHLPMRSATNIQLMIPPTCGSKDKPWLGGKVPPITPCNKRQSTRAGSPMTDHRTTHLVRLR